jgi:DNA-binding transcriptional LysR family regulator
VDAKLAEKGHSRRVALTVPNFMMALVQLAESDLIATLPRHLVERHAARFNLVTRAVPLPWTPDPVRVIASQAAMADVGIAWLFETVARSFNSPARPRSAKARRPRQ